MLIKSWYIKTMQDESDEEKRILLEDENVQLLEESERVCRSCLCLYYTLFLYAFQEQLSILDSFTGSPLPDDILLYAIPVCGPYSAMQNYK